MSVEDITQVVKIEQENFSDPWSRQAFLSSMEEENNHYLVAKEEDKVLGYVAYWGVLDEGQICNVSVKKEYQGKKIGYKLLRTLIEDGIQAGITAFTLEVRASNQKAISLYEKLGFLSAGVRKNFYTHPKEDAIIMWYYVK